MVKIDPKRPAHTGSSLKRVSTMLIVLLVLGSCICQQPAWGRGGREKQEPTYRRETRRESLPGGFTEIPIHDAAALEAYAFLREELEKTHPDVLLGAVQQAARQIVAGTNIRLVCAYRLAPNPAEHKLTATVYFDLGGKRSLRSIAFDHENGP